MAPPYTPVVLALTVEAPQVRRTTVTTEYHLAACVARLSADERQTAG